MTELYGLQSIKRTLSGPFQRMRAGSCSQSVVVLTVCARQPQWDSWRRKNFAPPNTLLPLTTYSFIYMAAKNKHNLVKFMQCIPSQLEPDVRNNHSARTPGSIPLKLLCCSLLKNMCRLQAENERKLPRVSLRVWEVTTLGSALAHRWQGKAQGPLGGLHYNGPSTGGSMRTGWFPVHSTYNLSLCE